jgi:hypothetical protein
VKILRVLVGNLYLYSKNTEVKRKKWYVVLLSFRASAPRPPSFRSRIRPPPNRCERFQPFYLGHTFRTPSSIPPSAPPRPPPSVRPAPPSSATVCSLPVTHSTPPPRPNLTAAPRSLVAVATPSSCPARSIPSAQRLGRGSRRRRRGRWGHRRGEVNDSTPFDMLPP